MISERVGSDKASNTFERSLFLVILVYLSLGYITVTVILDNQELQTLIRDIAEKSYLGKERASRGTPIFLNLLETILTSQNLQALMRDDSIVGNLGGEENNIWYGKPFFLDLVEETPNEALHDLIKSLTGDSVLGKESGTEEGGILYGTPVFLNLLKAILWFRGKAELLDVLQNWTAQQLAEGIIPQYEYESLMIFFTKYRDYYLLSHKHLQNRERFLTGALLRVGGGPKGTNHQNVP